MRARPRTVALAGVLAAFGLLGAGAGRTEARVVVSIPGLSLGVGVP